MEILIYREEEHTTIEQAAKSLNVSPQLIYYYIKNGRLLAAKIDKLVLVQLDSLVALNDYLSFRYFKK